MPKLPKKVKPYGLAIHQFRRFYRRMPDSLSRFELFKLLDSQRQERQKAFSKQFSLAVIIFVLLNANGLQEAIGIKTALIEISVPTIYVVFLQSVVIGFSFLELLSFQLVSGYRQVASDWVKGRFSDADLLAIPYHSESAWAALVLKRFGFLLLSKHFGYGQILSLVFIIVPLAVIYISMYITQCVFLWQYVSEGSSVLMGRVLVIVSVLMLLSPLVIVGFSAFSFKFEKNVSYVRWSFLHMLYRKLGLRVTYRPEWFPEPSSPSAASNVSSSPG